MAKAKKKAARSRRPRRPVADEVVESVEDPTLPKTDDWPKPMPAPNPDYGLKPEDGWRRVKTPRPWRPGEGEVLEGVYLGPRKADGQYGEYTKYVVAEDGTNKALYVTGTVADSLFLAGQLSEGQRVRIVYLGMKETEIGSYKDYELYVQDLA